VTAPGHSDPRVVQWTTGKYMKAGVVKDDSLPRDMGIECLHITSLPSRKHPRVVPYTFSGTRKKVPNKRSETSLPGETS
jgi:hypothetical protein